MMKAQSGSATKTSTKECHKHGRPLEIPLEGTASKSTGMIIPTVKHCKYCLAEVMVQPKRCGGRDYAR